jgi:hypothetical protein
MRSRLTSVTVLALVLMLHASYAPVSSAAQQADCRSIYSPGTGELTAEGCSSPFGCSKGRLDRDWLRGTFFATVDMIAPSAGMPTHEPPSTLSLSVTRVFSPRGGGTLIVHSTGVFDTVQGLGSELSIVTGGTGPWEGATGYLFVDTHSSSATTFEGVMSGIVCVP